MDLRRQVGGGRWTAGAMLPSRRDLARQYAVSLVTLDRAIGPLLADGTLRADDRRGTFVTDLLAPANGGSPSAAPDPAYQTGTVGIVATLPRPEGQEYLILHELEQVFSQAGRSTMVLNRAQAGEFAERIALGDAITSALREDLAGLIVICLDMDTAQIAERISSIDLGDTPTVCVLAGSLNLSIPHVFYDNRPAGYQAAQHLRDNGWEDITVLAPFTASWVSERIAGVRDALAYAQSPAPRLQVLSGEGREWDSRSDPRKFGYEAAQAALASGWRPTGGVICVNDGVAFGLLDATEEVGLEAGRDFAVLGFDDEPQARVLGLTSLRPPMQGMAREAARLLTEALQGVHGSLQVRLRAHVIPRTSTGRRRS